MIVWDLNKAIDIDEWSIWGGGWLERFYCIYKFIIHIWVILLNWALKYDMETKSENPPNNRKTFPNNIRIYVSMKVCTLLICQELKKKVSPFDLDLIHIDPYHARNMKIRHIQNIILICTRMPNKISLITVNEWGCLSRK